MSLCCTTAKEETESPGEVPLDTRSGSHGSLHQDESTEDATDEVKEPSVADKAIGEGDVNDKNIGNEAEGRNSICTKQ